MAEGERVPASAPERQALEDRNRSWAFNPLVPAWVDPERVGLDQFFTKPDVAAACYRSLLSWMRAGGVRESDCRFIEPAAGAGAFYDLLPPDRRVGIEIDPAWGRYERADFLGWQPGNHGLRYAVVGNPPFGYRAWLALAFVNHAASFAEYVGMILPMAFQSDGKGSPKSRVRGLELLHTGMLPPGSFTDRSGAPVQINALWQVWRRGVNRSAPRRSCDAWIDLFTVDTRKERLCGQKRLNEADYFLQRTFYGSSPTLARDFSQVRYGCGYGIVIKKQSRKVVSLLRKADWTRYSNLAAHNCRHISMYHIRKVLTDAGLSDE